MTRPSMAMLILALTIFGGRLGAQEPVTAADCEGCHEETVQAFLDGPHGQAMARTAERIAQGSCVACHGPIDAHMEDPSVETITTSRGQTRRTARPPTSAPPSSPRRGGRRLTAPAAQ